MRGENRIRVSVLDAGRILLRHLEVFPETKATDAVRQLMLGPAYLANYDFETALPMVVNTEQRIFRLLENRRAELRYAILEIAKADQPFWAHAAIYGRQKALRCVNADQAQCLKDAGLAENPMDDESRVWWTRLSNEFRLLQESEQRTIGSDAEYLSLEYEKSRLAKLGIEKAPYLISHEDQTVGYDLQSYTILDGKIVSHFVEVKGTTSSEPRFFLSRNEWSACLKLSPHYVVHVWNMTDRTLTVFTRQTLEAHVPVDQGTGTWMNSQFLLRGLGVESLIQQTEE